MFRSIDNPFKDFRLYILLVDKDALVDAVKNLNTRHYDCPLIVHYRIMRDKMMITCCRFSSPLAVFSGALRNDFPFDMLFRRSMLQVLFPHSDNTHLRKG